MGRSRTGIQTLVVLVFLTQSVLTATAVATDTASIQDSSIAERLLHSRDVDEDERPPFTSPYLVEVVADSKSGNYLFPMPDNEFSTDVYAKNGDYYYTYARPPILISRGDGSQMEVFDLKWVFVEEIVKQSRLKTLMGYRLQLMENVAEDTSNERSVWSESQSNLYSKGPIKDAHIEILGITGSPRTNLYGKQDTYVLDDKGRVMTQADFRIEGDDKTGECTEPRTVELRITGGIGDLSFDQGLQEYKIRYCYTTYKFQLPTDGAVTRSVTIGGQDGHTYRGTLSWENPGKFWSRKRSIGYDVSKADVGSGVTTLQAKTTIKVRKIAIKELEIRKNSLWIDHELLDIKGKFPVSLDESKTIKVTAKSEEKRVIISQKNKLSITQRVVENENGPRYVVLEFEGPKQFSQRRLWQTIMFKTHTVVNGWGVYSYQDTKSGYVSENGEGVSRTDYNRFLDVRLTSRRDGLRVRKRIYPSAELAKNDINPLEYPYQPRIVSTDTFEMTAEPAETKPTVNLVTSKAVGYNRLVIRTRGSTSSTTPAPGEVQVVRDIHGDKIEISTTTYHTMVDTELVAEELDNDNIRFTLTREDTGEPMAGATIHLQGAEQATATTNKDGKVTVTPEKETVRGRYQGTEFADLNEGAAYFRGASAGAGGDTTFNLGASLASFLNAFLAISGIFILYLPVRIIRRSD